MDKSFDFVKVEYNLSNICTGNVAADFVNPVLLTLNYKFTCILLFTAHELSNSAHAFTHT